MRILKEYLQWGNFMEITYELTEEDYTEFNLIHIKNSPSLKRNFKIIRVVLPVIAALIAFFIGTSVFYQPVSYWIIISLLLMIGLWFYYPKVYEDSIRKQAKRLLNEGDNSSFFGVKKLIIEEESIRIIDADASESIISIQNIKEVKESENHIILYLSAIQGVIIPKRNMAGGIQRELREALEIFQMETDMDR